MVTWYAVPQNLKSPNQIDQNKPASKRKISLHIKRHAATELQYLDCGGGSK